MKIREIINNLQSENLKLKKEVDKLKKENKLLKTKLDEMVSLQKLMEEIESSKKNIQIPVQENIDDLDEANLVFGPEEVIYENDQVVVDCDDSDFDYDKQSTVEVFVENKSAKRRKRNRKV